MRDALLRGELGISALSPRVTTGKEQWQDWHHDFAANQMVAAIEDDATTLELAAAMDHDSETIHLDPEWTALQARPCPTSLLAIQVLCTAVSVAACS